MKRIALGTKLTLWSGLIVVLAVFASALASDIFVYRTERRELDRELHQAAHHFFEQYRIHGARPEWVVSHGIEEVFSPHDDTRFVLVRGADGRALYRSPNMPTGLDLPTGSGMHKARIGPVGVRLGVYREHGLVLYLAGSTAEFTDLIVKLIVGHLVTLPFVLAVVALGAWWLGRQALRPVKAMADAAEAIQPDELDRRLPETVQVDEIGRLARVFNEMLERLQRGFQQATRFSSDASHELRTPLAVLRASIESLLEDPALPDEQREAVVELQYQTQRLISITNSLLLLARADAGRLQLQLEEVDLRDLVLDCYEDAQILGEQHEIKVECVLNDPVPVRADALRLRQALLNLLDNGIKYNEPNGRVELRLESAGGRARVRVGNTGPAIPEEERAGLFGRFFRAGRYEDTPGSGLGLSLARELVRSHGGDIVLLSSREGWNEFELSIPLHPTATAGNRLPATQGR